MEALSLVILILPQALQKALVLHYLFFLPSFSLKYLISCFLFVHKLVK